MNLKRYVKESFVLEKLFENLHYVDFIF